MKVAYDYQIFSIQKYGGISRIYYELITRAIERGEVDVSLFMGLHINRYGLDAVRGPRARTLAAARPDSPRIKRAARIANRVGAELFLRVDRPDVYHATYYAELGRGTRAKRIVTVYDMIHERYPEQFRGDDTPAHKRRAVAAADRVIAISHATKADVVELLGTDPAKIDVIHLANSLTFEVSESSLFAEPYVLYVASRQYYKGFPTLLEAYAASPRVHDALKLVCFGTKPFTAEEQSELTRLGIADRVVYQAGDDATLARLYQHATMFVYPSRYEGFGLSPLEAMHYGCPVIASRSSSIPEVVRDAGLYFAPGDEEELRAAMERILDDVALRQELIHKGRENERGFSWDAMYEQTLATYRR